MHVNTESGIIWGWDFGGNVEQILTPLMPVPDSEGAIWKHFVLHRSLSLHCPSSDLHVYYSVEEKIDKE